MPLPCYDSVVMTPWPTRRPFPRDKGVRSRQLEICERSHVANIDEKSPCHFTNGAAKFQNDMFWSFAANGVAQPYWQNAANANLFADPILRQE